VTHSVIDILRARMFAIACGYQDADDLDYLRSDPGFKLACGRLPDSGDDLCSQPTMSRWENAPSLREVVRMTYAMIDAYCASYPHPPDPRLRDCDVPSGGGAAAARHDTFGRRSPSVICVVWCAASAATGRARG
jgi:hypothetical protein